jgi:hypothetical protein
MNMTDSSATTMVATAAAVVIITLHILLKQRYAYNKLLLQLCTLKMSVPSYTIVEHENLGDKS